MAEKIPCTSTTLTKQQARALERSDYIRYLQEADLSDARRYFQLARLTTRQHDKAELMAGAMVGIIVALIVGGGAWSVTLLAGLGAFGATLLVIFLIHWIRSPSALHKAAVVASKAKAQELEAEKSKNDRRTFFIEQLRELINEHKSIDVYFDITQDISKQVYHLEQEVDHDFRVKKLFERYLESADLERYQVKGKTLGFKYTRVLLEEVLQKIVDGEIRIKPSSNASHPKGEDHRDGLSPSEQPLP